MALGTDPDCVWDRRAVTRPDECPAQTLDRTSYPGQCFYRQCTNIRGSGALGFCRVHEAEQAAGEPVVVWSGPKGAKRYNMEAQPPASADVRYGNYVAMRRTESKQIIGILNEIGPLVQRRLEELRLIILELRTEASRTAALLVTLTAERDRLQTDLRACLARATTGEAGAAQQIADLQTQLAAVQQDLIAARDRAAALAANETALNAQIATLRADAERKTKQLEDISQWVEVLNTDRGVLQAAQNARAIAGAAGAAAIVPGPGPAAGALPSAQVSAAVASSAAQQAASAASAVGADAAAASSASRRASQRGSGVSSEGKEALSAEAEEKKRQAAAAAELAAKARIAADIAQRAAASGEPDIAQAAAAAASAAAASIPAAGVVVPTEDKQQAGIREYIRRIINPPAPAEASDVERTRIANNIARPTVTALENLVGPLPGTYVLASYPGLRERNREYNRLLGSALSPAQILTTQGEPGQSWGQYLTALFNRSRQASNPLTREQRAQAAAIFR